MGLYTATHHRLNINFHHEEPQINIQYNLKDNILYIQDNNNNKINIKNNNNLQ